MIEEIKTFFCDKFPTDEDIKQAITIAINNNCTIKLCWKVGSKNCRIFINSKSTLSSVKNQWDIRKFKNPLH